MGRTARPLGKTFFLQCQERHPELPKIPSYLPLLVSLVCHRLCHLMVCLCRIWACWSVVSCLDLMAIVPVVVAFGQHRRAGLLRERGAACLSFGQVQQAGMPCACDAPLFGASVSLSSCCAGAGVLQAAETRGDIPVTPKQPYGTVFASLFTGGPLGPERPLLATPSRACRC